MKKKKKVICASMNGNRLQGKDQDNILSNSLYYSWEEVATAVIGFKDFRMVKYITQETKEKVSFGDFSHYLQHRLTARWLAVHDHIATETVTYCLEVVWFFPCVSPKSGAYDLDQHLETKFCQCLS